MRPPRWVWGPALVGAALVVVPLAAVVARVPWARLGEVVTSPASADALLLSARTAVASTALVLILGVPLALALAALPARAGAVVRTVVLSPLVLPPVVAGLALLAAFGRGGLVGPALGGRIAFTTVAVVLAQTFVSLPYLVLAVDGALRGRDPRAEGVAATLGAGPTRVLRTVTLRSIAPSLVTGAVLALARSLGEFGATLTFAGSLQGVTRTLPLEIYLQRESDPDAALGLSLVLLAVALGVVGAVHGRSTRGGVEPARPGDTVAAEQPGEPAGRVGATPGAGSSPPASLTVAVHVPERGCHLALDVPAGSCLAVVGPNGAGKSTLLGVVAGLVRPSAGRVGVDGVDVTRLPPHRRGVGLVPQAGVVLPVRTVLDDVAYGPRAAGLPRAAARERALAELELVGAAHLAARRPGTLSGGQAQRVALARALATRPRLLLLDEPFAALDAAATEEVRAVVADALRRTGTTTLLVTHDPADVRGLADHVAVVEDGRVVEHGPVAAVAADPRSGLARRLLG